MTSVEEHFSGDGITATFATKYIPQVGKSEIFVNSSTTPLTENTDYTIDYTTGAFTLVSIPAAGIAIVDIYDTDLTKTFDVIVNNVLYNLTVNQSEVTDFNVGSITRTLVEAISNELAVDTETTDSVYAKLLSIYNSGFLSTASGSDLDMLVELVGITRLQAAQATGTVTFGVSSPATSDIVIAAGTTISTIASGTTPAIQFTTTQTVTLPSGSSSVDASVIAQLAGSTGNVGSGAITIFVTAIPGIDTVTNAVSTSGGTDLETDANLRIRAQNALAVSAKATSNAIIGSVLNTGKATLCTLYDLEYLTVDESHVHTSFIATPTFNTTNTPVVFIKEITGTRGGNPVTFEQGVDYTLTNASTGEVTWASDLLDPDDGTTFYVDYAWTRLGAFDIYVANQSGATISASDMDTIDSVVSDTKAAGITYSLSQPSVVTVDATVTVTKITGYDSTLLQTAVSNAISNFINTQDIGDDVYRASLFKIIMGVPGVQNVVITDPAADVTIVGGARGSAGTISVMVV